MALRSERRFISYTKVQSGMLLEFVYRKEDGSSKSYRALVIDPSRKNAHTEKSGNEQLHAFMVDDLNDEQVFNLMQKVGRKIYFDPTTRHSPLTKLDTDEAYHRYAPSDRAERRYRTFNTKNMSLIRQILIGSVGDGLIPHPALSKYKTEAVSIATVKKYMEYPNRPLNMEMVKNIKANGIREPLLLAYYPSDNTALLIEGNHRLLAADIVGYDSVPVRVVVYSKWIRGGTGSQSPKPVRGVTPGSRMGDEMPPSDIGLT